MIFFFFIPPPPLFAPPTHPPTKNVVAWWEGHCSGNGDRITAFSSPVCFSFSPGEAAGQQAPLAAPHSSG